MYMYQKYRLRMMLLMEWREEKKNRYRECILKHAFEQFSKLGYEKTNLSDISKLCGIAEGTLYNYFVDKPTLFVATFTLQTMNKLNEFHFEAPNSITMLIDQFGKTLEFFLMIEDPGLERAFKTYYHLLKSIDNPERDTMSKPLIEADEYVHNELDKLFSHVIFKDNSGEKLLDIIKIQFDGLLNEYIYLGTSFSDLIKKTKENMYYILKPYIEGFNEV